RERQVDRDPQAAPAGVDGDAGAGGWLHHLHGRLEGAAPRSAPLPQEVLGHRGGGVGGGSLDHGGPFEGSHTQQAAVHFPPLPADLAPRRATINYYSLLFIQIIEL